MKIFRFSVFVHIYYRLAGAGYDGVYDILKDVICTAAAVRDKGSSQHGRDSLYSSHEIPFGLKLVLHEFT